MLLSALQSGIVQGGIIILDSRPGRLTATVMDERSSTVSWLLGTGRVSPYLASSQGFLKFVESCNIERCTSTPRRVNVVSFEVSPKK